VVTLRLDARLHAMGEAEYIRQRAHAQTGGRKRVGVGSYQPAEIRNGVPFRPYRYHGAGHDTMECACHA
jgi:hypothetical protein